MYSYMHLVKLTFWPNSKLQFVLINRTCLCKLTSSDTLIFIMILEIV